ncbi:MAG: carboxypeptidase-like regulatory domain-containing protein [Cyanobacteria bacterium J06649_11]
MFCQDNYFPVTFFVINSESNAPLEGASIAVKEIGYQSKTTGYDGKAVFESVPEGEINYLVTLEGHQGVEGIFNITSEIKSNTVSIKLLKIPSPQASMILVSGEVLDKNGREIHGADVELRLGRILKNTTTDDSGNFSVEINLDDLIYQDDDIDVEVDHQGCITKDKILLPKRNYIHRSIDTDCVVFSGPDDSQNAPSLTYEGQDVEFIITKVTKRRDKVVCEFTLKNLDSREPEKTITINAGHSKIVDVNGIECTDNRVRIGSVTDTEIGRVPATGKLPYNVPIRSSLEFPICDLESSFESGLSFLQINCNYKSGYGGGFRLQAMFNTIGVE